MFNLDTQNPWRFLGVCAAGLCGLAIGAMVSTSRADDADTITSTKVDHFATSIEPMLEQYCYGCHAYGAQEGGVSFDSQSQQELLDDPKLWWKVLKNVRAGMMPPLGETRPTTEEIETLGNWIYRDVFAVDADQLDPGKVTVRRLNRTEYRNTIRDLMGIDFNAEVVFPPDDSGFGFDTVGDVLGMSPLLMEKYLQSARTIVAEAVPTVTKITPRFEFGGDKFRSEDGQHQGNRVNCDVRTTLKHSFDIQDAGSYSLKVAMRSHGSFFFNPARCDVEVRLDGKPLYRDQYGWDERKIDEYSFELDLSAGSHEIVFDIQPVPIDPDDLIDVGDDTYASITIQSVDFEGPLNAGKWVHPDNYERFFTRDAPPDDPAERRVYAGEVLQRFARLAYRRDVEAAYVERLVLYAEQQYEMPGKTFEAGVAQAMVAVLASPRFLFRVEQPMADADDRYPLIDEYALASRLSYFLWSTMPDEELLELACAGKLRENLLPQVDRMLADRRSEEFISNFVGQWLRSRDIEHVSIDPASVLGLGEEMEQLRDQFRRSRNSEMAPEERAALFAKFRAIRKQTEIFDEDVREAMQRETEMMFEHIVRENRSLLEIIDSDYVFVNEKLAKLYGLEGVEGEEMRQVSLPEGDPRGGLLTQGTMLVVTSNPTRTSPVKRGLYILDNILGLAPPPPPPNIPDLEAAAENHKGQDLSLRELLALHREAPLCSSCHSRMDPLGLALENFNALGMWRTAEGVHPIDAAGQLATGEPFQDIRDLKRILIDNHRREIYRCITQKLMTYALGRGIEYQDDYPIDQIVQQLDRDNGRFSTLISALVQSPAFQRQRCEQAAEELAAHP